MSNLFQALGLGLLSSEVELLRKSLGSAFSRISVLEQFKEKTQMDFTKLSKVVSNVAAEALKLKGDFAAYVAANPPADPAGQATVDALTATLDSVSSGLQEMDDTLVAASGGQAQEPTATPSAPTETP